MTVEIFRRAAHSVRLGSISFAVLFLLASCQHCLGQGLIAGEEEKEGSNPVQAPFLLPAQPTEIGEAMEDFRRFAGRKQWEKAFKHLEKIFGATSEGLVLTGEGVMLPSRMIAREALLELPVTGQDAYRLFFDPEAKKLYEQANGKEELTKLSHIFSRFLITSMGDVAADRLGDLYFESGHLEQAVSAWRTILEQRPDTQISKARLRTKMAVALARLNRWNEFKDILATVEQQHADDKMMIGGKEVLALDHLRAIAEKVKDRVAVATTSGANGPLADIPLGEKVDPLWQFRFFPGSDPKEGVPMGLQVMNQNRWGGDMQSGSDWVPPVVVDGTRAYVNFVGYDLALDMVNGKLLWRSGRIFDVQQKAQQNQLSPLEQYGLALASGRLWSVARESGDQNQGRQNARFVLTSREPDTGKKLFSTQQAPEFKELSVRGTPLVVGERMFLTANKVNQPRELELLALNSKDGKQIWSSKIGSYTTDSNPYSSEKTFQPSVILHGGHLFVDTHSGSLVQLDAASGQLEWGLNYSSDVAQQHRFFWYGMQSTEPFTIGPPQIVDGVLYLKGMRSRKLFAVDPDRPKVAWHRSVPITANLIGVDDSKFYLGGDDISAFDLKTRRILWSVKINHGTTWAKSLLTQGRIFHFSARGIFEIDKEKGKVVRVFRGTDLESMGGSMIVTPTTLLTISNLAITAYPLKTNNGETKPEATNAAVDAPTDRVTVVSGSAN